MRIWHTIVALFIILPRIKTSGILYEKKITLSTAAPKGLSVMDVSINEESLEMVKVVVVYLRSHSVTVIYAVIVSTVRSPLKTHPFLNTVNKRKLRSRRNRMTNLL